MLAEEIFHQDLIAIYQHQTQQRDELTKEAGEIMGQLISEMQGSTLVNQRIEQLMYDDSPPDINAVFDLLREEANAGNPLAIADLGRIYAQGVGRDADPEQANEWHANALAAFLEAEKVAPNSYIHYRIGRMFLHGAGTEQDEAAALPWLGRSAECGNISAKYTLGKAYLLGQDIPQDHTEAIRWLKLSEEQGNQYAQYFLDHFYDSVFSSATSLLYHMGNILQEQRQRPVGGVRVTVASKLKQKIREKKIAMGHKPDDHEDQEQAL